MDKKDSTKKSFDAQATINQARDDYIKATDGEGILSAVSRAVWVIDHKTEPPEKAIATPLTISRWFSGFGKKERDAFVRSLTQNKEMAVAWEKRWVQKEEMVVEWPMFTVAIYFVLCEPPEGDKKPTGSIDVEDAIKYLRAIGEDMPDGADMPLSMVVGAWQNRPRTIETASTTQAKGVVRIPYRTSEVLRRNWKPFDGDVNAVMVDGEPLAARMTDVIQPSKGKKAQVYMSKGQGQLSLAIPTRREPDARPVVLIAFEYFCDDLRSSIATDVAILMTVAHVSNQDIRVTSAEGARALARDRKGKARDRIRNTDKQRFENAFGALHGMSKWMCCPDGIIRLFPLIKSDRINDDVVEFGPPTWAKNEHGLYTLSGAFGQASAARLIGRANDGGLWRTVAGVEYWLARGPAVWSKKHGRMIGIAKTLLPESGKTGPGEWQKREWRRLLNLSGDVWNESDKREEAKARKRYERRVARLKSAGYFTPSLGSQPAKAGDTVEFHQSDRGYIHVRATDRFVEAARLADEGVFETVRLADFMGI